MHIKVRGQVARDNAPPPPAPESAMRTHLYPARFRQDRGVLDLACPTDTRRFHAGVGSLDLLRALRDSRQRQRPLALNLHWPCNDGGDDYLRSLTQEIQLIGCQLGPRQPVEHFYLRGTPPAMEVLQPLMAQLRERFHFLDHDRGDYRIDLDPWHMDWATMGLLREQGFNHASIGVPDAHSDGPVSQARYQDPAPIESLVDAARTFGFRSVNIDLGYGHAWQTPASFDVKLASLIALEPDRVQVFDYAQAPARYQARPPQAFCSEAGKSAMRRSSFQHLTAAGYHYIGLGQFARADDDLKQAQERGRLSRNCEGFTLHGYCDHVGFGLGAISQIDTLCAQNTTDARQYREQLGNAQLATGRGWLREAADPVRLHVAERLACDLELDIQAVERRYGLVFPRYFANLWPLLEALHRDGLIELTPTFIWLLPAGLPQVDGICALFERAALGTPVSANDEVIDHECF